jgi:hypothetical protein
LLPPDYNRNLVLGRLIEFGHVKGMIKRVVSAESIASLPAEPDWLGMESFAQAEVTSEDPAFPLESALGLSDGPGWQAAAPGPQTIRLLFDHPMRVRRIHLVFEEKEQERTQEFVLRWSADGGKTYQQILRQQYHFHVSATREVEDYDVNLNEVTALELQITPDIRGGETRASLHRWQIG